MLFEKIEDKVLFVLKQNKQARADDYILICEVYKLDHENVTKLNFDEVMKNHKKWNLPSFHTITRTRRKLFEKYPELKPEKVTVARTELEKEYKDYAKGFYD